MRGLLFNAVYTTQYSRWKEQHQQLSSWDKLQHVLNRLIEEQDPIPVVGTAMGLLLGSVIVLLFFLIWYQCLRRHRNEAGREYVNALSIVSRATSDDTQYQRRKRAIKPKPSLWTRLLRKVKPTTATDDSSMDITVPACYLLYESEMSSGRLVQYYSKTPMEDEHLIQHKDKIVAIWKPASHISAYKFTQNAGRSVLIDNCSIGFQGKHNYCHGVCQFLESAHANGGGAIAMMKSKTEESSETSSLPYAVDVYFYLNETRPQYQTLPLGHGKMRTMPGNSLGVACLPEQTAFYKNTTVDLYKWLADGERHGSSLRF